MNPENKSEEQQKKEHFEKAKKYADFSIMAYQMYAGGLQYGVDPFYTKHGDNKKIQQMLHEQAKGFNQTAPDNIDFISYNPPDYSNIDLKKPTYYGAGDYYEPPEFAGKIGRMFHGDKLVREYDDKSGKDDSIDVYTFEGSTGIEGENKGFPSTMGYVAYNRETKEITVSFRGSRSGSAAKAAIGGLFLDSGNPDWMTDMNIAGDLIENDELMKGEGKLASGFANTYASCRPGLVDILKKIRESDPNPETPPKLVTTGHSLGGALASMMFIDAKKGRLNEVLKDKLGGETKEEKEKNEKFVTNLLKESECFAFSCPPVCDNKAVENIGNQDNKFQRVFFDNDPIVYGGNVLRMFKGRSLTEHKELLCNINSKSDISLGDYQGKAFDIFRPHEMYLVHEELQKKLGAKENEIKKLWYKVEDMKITHASGETKDLNKEQAAVIANQFNHEYFLTLSRIMAEQESHNSGDTELIKYIEEIGKTLQKDPCESEKKFEEFRGELAKIVTKLEGKIFNDEKKWDRRIAHKVNDVIYSGIKVAGATVNLVNDFANGLNDYLKQKQKQKKEKKSLSSIPEVSSISGASIPEPPSAEELKLNKVINELTTICDDINNKMMKYSEKITDTDDPKTRNAILSKYKSSLSKNLKPLEKKIGELIACDAVLKTKAKADKIIFDHSRKLAENLKSSINACKDLLDEKDSNKYKEKYSGLLENTYKTMKTFSLLETEVTKRSQKFDLLHNIKESGANAFMLVSGMTFGFKKGIAKLLISLKDLGKSIGNLFKPASVTKNYMHDVLSGISTAYKATDFKTLKEDKESRKKVEKVTELENKPKM